MIHIEVKNHVPAPWCVQVRRAARTPSYNAMRAWKLKVTSAANRSGQYIAGPVVIQVAFYLPMPRTWPAWKRAAGLAGEIAHTVAPDVDNLCKSTIDACKGILFADDVHVTAVKGSKTWVDSEASAGATVTIAPAVGVPAQVRNRDALRASLHVQSEAAE